MGRHALHIIKRCLSSFIESIIPMPECAFDRFEFSGRPSKDVWAHKIVDDDMRKWLGGNKLLLYHCHWLLTAWNTYWIS